MEQSFEGQREGENVLGIVRRHPIAMRKGFYAWIVILILGMMPMLLFPLNPDLFWIFIGAIILGGIFFFLFWVSWYFTLYVITDQRIQFTSQKGLFGKSVIEVPLSKIQNISYKIPGMSGELFKYGTIVLQTIVGDLVLDRIFDPKKTYKLIQDAIHNRKDGEDGQDFEDS